MTKKKLLFSLFFLAFVFSNHAFAQTVNDSLTHYVAVVNQQREVSELAKAYVFLDRDREISLKEGNGYRAAYDLDYLSLIEFQLGLFKDSEKTAVEALELLDKLSPIDYSKSLRYRLMNRIGMINWEFKDYENAIKYHSELLRYVRSKSDSVTVYNNLGISYKSLKEYDLARINLQKSYELSKEIDNDMKLARSLDNLGFVQAMLSLDEGIENMMEALKIRELKIKDLYPSYKHLTEYYKFKKDSTKALFYAYKAYNVAFENKAESYQLDALRNLIDLKQYDFIDKYVDLSDSLYLKRQLNENRFAKIKYDLSKVEARAEKEKSTRRMYQFIGIVVILILISTIVTLRFYHKRNTLQKQFETEQRISKKLHDEVANDVFHVMNKVQNDAFNQHELVDDLEDIYHKTRDLSNANSELDVSEDYVLLLNDLLHSYKTVNVNIFTKDIAQVSWETISDEKKKVLYRVLQELMTNMKKHSDASLVTFIFEQTKNKVKVDYTDNGVGCDIYKGNGLRNTENRIDMVGGRITFESEPGNGFKAKIRI